METGPSTILEVLLERAARQPEATAFALGEKSLTYRELLEKSLELAGSLRARGVEPGAHVALLLPTCLEFVVGLFGVMALGGVPMAIDPSRPADFLLGRLRASRCSHALTDLPMRASLAAAEGSSAVTSITPEEIEADGSPPLAAPWAARPEDPVVLQSTSGTSGEARTAVLLHRNLMASVRASADRLGATSRDVLVIWVPLHHSLGLNRLILGGVYFGSAVHMVPAGIAHLRTWLTTISRVRGTITGAPDFAYRTATAIVPPRDLDLRSLRFALNSGEPIRRSTLEKFEATFGLSGVLRPGYGLAEASGVAYYAPGEPLRVDHGGTVACGRPADGLELAIVDEEGRPVERGATGEIRLRGEQIFPGYLDDEAATREKLEGGWMRTGDLAWQDAEGYLFVQGRMRALIKRGGASIVPRDVEEHAEKVDGVLLSAAVGVEGDGALGTEELVVVVEVAGAAAREEAIVRAVSDAVAAGMGFTPGSVRVVTPGTIPRTSNGKVRHEELRRQLTREKRGPA